MQNQQIRDPNLAAEGELKIDWARRHMPVLATIREEFEKNQPFAGLKIALSVHLEAKTAVLCLTLAAGGAEMYVTGSNPLSTQDDVAAALAAQGLHVYAWYNSTPEEYKSHLTACISAGPDIIIDDGGDLVNLIHNEFPQLTDKVIGGCEETTTGILRLQAMHAEGALKFPMVLVNDAMCKHFFDNRYGTGQSVWDGIDRTTNLVVAGKTVVVAGYGWCGKGVAMRAKGQGAHVVVTEIDPVKAIEAVMDGFEVMPMEKAAAIGDIFVTVTGCCKVISEREFAVMKDGAVLCNAGHFNVEVDVAALERLCQSHRPCRRNIEGYRLADGRWLYVLAEGRLVNLAAGDGHPAEIMDMSFAIQAQSAAYLAAHRGETLPRLIGVPGEIDVDVAWRKLRTMGREIDALTEEQRQYLNSWNV